MSPSHTSPNDSANSLDLSSEVAATLETLGARLKETKDEISKVIYGQETVIDHSLITLLAGGHALLVGVPGLGKTLLVETLGSVLGLNEKRVQFTPDLMPADILGSEILEESDTGKRHFRFVEGPVFCQLLMADEINRASPRTQSALLQAMQEGRVSIAGHTHELPQPFHVLATQNPIEQEGTYPLPEAQLDRFLCQINVGYPDADAERVVVLNTTGTRDNSVSQVLSADELMQAQRLVRQIPVGEKIVDAILAVVRNGRPESTDLAEVKNHVMWGPGPRASQALMLAVRARALLTGRYSPSIDDIIAMAEPVLRHRMALSFSARAEGITLGDVIEKLLAPIR